MLDIARKWLNYDTVTTYYLPDLAYLWKNQAKHHVPKPWYWEIGTRTAEPEPRNQNRGTIPEEAEPRNQNRGTRTKEPELVSYNRRKRGFSTKTGTELENLYHHNTNIWLWVIVSMLPKCKSILLYFIWLPTGDQFQIAEDKVWFKINVNLCFEWLYLWSGKWY